MNYLKSIAKIWLATVLIFSTLAFTTTTAEEPPKKVEINGFKLAAIEYQVPVEASIDEVWTALAEKYTEVDEISAGIIKSGGIENHPEVGDGAARYCDIYFKKRDIKVKEKIVAWDAQSTQKEYMYDVYELVNFPMKKMYNVWGVQEKNGQVTLYHRIYYKMKPGILTGIMRGQMKKVARDSVLGYKHYIETGEGNVASKVLREKYPTF